MGLAAASATDAISPRVTAQYGSHISFASCYSKARPVQRDYHSLLTPAVLSVSPPGTVSHPARDPTPHGARPTQERRSDNAQACTHMTGKREASAAMGGASPTVGTKRSESHGDTVRPQETCGTSPPRKPLRERTT